jgi:hypothetical protein
MFLESSEIGAMVMRASEKETEVPAEHSCPFGPTPAEGVRRG